MATSEKSEKLQNILRELIGLQIFKAWNIFGTRIFYFAGADLGARTADGDYRLTLECPWRIEQHDRVVVGSEDYGLRADDNSDPDWNPTEMQWGHLQDQKLLEIFGKSRNGEIYNTRRELVVTSVKADTFGGFQLALSGGYALTVFPASVSDMEWLLSRRAGGNVALTKGTLSESVG